MKLICLGQFFLLIMIIVHQIRIENLEACQKQLVSGIQETINNQKSDANLIKMDQNSRDSYGQPTNPIPQ